MIRVQFLLATLLVTTVLTQTVQTQDGIQGGVKSLLTDSTQVASKSSRTGSQSEQSEKAAPAEEQRIQAEIAEIMAIRKRLGGGVSERLEGFSIEMPGGNKGQVQVPDGQERASFEEAFAKQLAQQSRNSRAVPASAGKGWHLETVTEESAMPTQERRETVRHAARMLEEAAAMLEEASEYEQADKVRQTAAELWRAARRQ